MGIPVPYVATHHQRLQWLGQSIVDVLLDSAATAGQLTVVRSALVAGDASPWHEHGREDEIFVLLEGEATVWVGDARHEVGSGGVAVLPRGVPHGYLIRSAAADMLTLATPAGLEGFFRAAGHDLAAPLPPGWTIEPPALAAAFAAHGGTILGPPRHLVAG